MANTSEASLNVADIRQAVQIIDAAADHGVFKGWELIRQVMLVRDRLDAFATAVTAQVEMIEE
jgi:hypothetical protein